MPKAKKNVKKAIADDFAPERGKSPHQKLKLYLVLEYLMQNTDEENPTTIDDIAYYLDTCGICGGNDSIKDDIKEINYALYMLEQACSIDVAVEDLDSGDYDEDKFIKQTANRRGYYVNRRRNEITEIDARLLAETVYTARFLDEQKAKRLVNIACSLVSSQKAGKIKHELPLLDRPRTTNKSVYLNLTVINDAIRKGTKEDHHVPEKITFRYQTYNIDDIEKTIDRRDEDDGYKVSPYKLLIDNGNYYLLAFDDRTQQIRTYRVDRMKGIKLTGEQRDGEDEFAAIELKNYTQRVFGMFRGKRTKVTLCFNMMFLDTVIDRFGTKEIRYIKQDDSHFIITPDIEVSPQFFAWLCIFGDKVQILEPDFVVLEFKSYLDRIRSLY